MIVTLLFLIPLVGGLLAWVAGRIGADEARWVALGALVIDLLIALGLWTVLDPALLTFRAAWVPQVGISFYLVVDTLSLILITLTLFLGIAALLASWAEITERVGFFHFNLLAVLAGIIGVFMALDLFLFYFFWELMLIPMYFLIAIWGHERRVYAAIKFFIFTQLSSLLMLASIIALYFSHGNQTGTYTYDYAVLLAAVPMTSFGPWVMLGFLAAFLVKLPAFPFHTWLPDAHTEAPTAGSVILAGLLLKTGAYGLLRFVLPLFPQAVERVAGVMLILGAVGIIYGAVLAFAQTDLKRLVAYTSVSHMGFVLLGVFSQNMLALQGALMQIICHGLSTGALFILVGALSERTGTRDLREMSGLWRAVPQMGAVALFFAMASLGLPGLGNFIGEVLVLMGAYQVNVPVTVAATLGLIAATIYALYFFQATFQGPLSAAWSRLPDLAPREWLVMGALMLALVWLGLYPQPVFEASEVVFSRLADAPGQTVLAEPYLPLIEQ